MTTLTLQQYPNQEFSFVNDGVEYDIRLHLYRGITYASVSVNGVKAIESARCVSHQWIIPSKAYANKGNFRFECDDPNEYPNYKLFGVLCKLRFYTAEEIEEM